jgi:moderate conductance mechanosensitive channel
VAVAYNTDIDFAGDVIKRTIVDQWRDERWQDVILEEPQVWGVENLGADGVTIRIVVKTLPSKQWEVARHLRARIKAAFDQAGIEIPFPQRTIWHRNPPDAGLDGGDGRAGDDRRRSDDPDHGAGVEPAMSSPGPRAQ